MVDLGKLSDDVCLMCGAATHGEDVPHRQMDAQPIVVKKRVEYVQQIRELGRVERFDGKTWVELE